MFQAAFHPIRRRNAGILTAVAGIADPGRHQRCALKPGLGEIREIWKQVSRRVEHDQREQICCSRPDNAEENSADRERNYGVRKRVERRRIRAEFLHNSCMPENESGRVRQSKNERHQNDPSYFRAKPRAEARLKQRPEKEFFDESGFNYQPR